MIKIGDKEVEFKPESVSNGVGASHVLHFGSCGCSTKQSYSGDYFDLFSTLDIDMDLSRCGLWVREHMPDSKGGGYRVRMRLNSEFFASTGIVFVSNGIWAGWGSGSARITNVTRNADMWYRQAHNNSGNNYFAYTAKNASFNTSYDISGDLYEFYCDHSNGWGNDNVDVLLCPFGS